MPGLLGSVVDLAITAFVLQGVGAMTSSLKVDGWGSAFLAALVMTVLGFLVGLVVPFVPLDGTWQFIAVLLVTNTILVMLAAIALPGIEVHGLSGVLLAGVLLTMVDYAWPYLWTLIASAIPS